VLEKGSKDVLTGADYQLHFVAAAVLVLFAAIANDGILASTTKKGHGNITIGGMTPFLHWDHRKSLESDRITLGFTTTMCTGTEAVELYHLKLD
jgi:hypothetical protein